MYELRLLAALVLLVTGILANVRVPHGRLWKPAVVATTYGVWLVTLALGVILSGDGTDAPSAVALAAGALLVVPILRAREIADAVAAQVTGAFGDTPWSADAHADPFTIAHLLRSPGGRRRPVHTHAYGDHPNQHLVLHPGHGPGPHPVVVAVHGGSWNSGDPGQLPGVYRYLAARGISVAAVTYRFAPDHVFPAQLVDLEAALAWLRRHAAELDTDPDHTVLLGRSAGGHLALLAAYRHVVPGVCGVVSLYGPTDLHWSWDNPSNPWVLDSPTTLSEFLGGPRDAVPDAYTAASPLALVDAACPPTLLVHGGRDELVYAEQSRRLAAALQDHHVPHALVETPWDTHGLDANLSGPGGQLYLWSLERFLGAVLRA